MANRLTKTMGAGFSALGGGNKTFFVIEHKTESSKHKAGESQQIIVDHIELGRDSKCAVRFGDKENTVSRKHASISKDTEGNYVIRNLSETNQTLVNDRPVEKEWYLKNGDEIKLSVEGPRLAFLTPANNKTSTIGMTRRLSLFARQAMRPYKTQIRVLTGVIVAAVAVIIYMVYFYITGLQPQMNKLSATNQQFADSIKSINAKNTDLQKQFKAELNKIKIVENNRPPASAQQSLPPIDDLKKLYPNIYLVDCDKIVVEYKGQQEEINRPADEKQYIIEGTGFLLDDGRFVTARHVVQPWFFWDEGDDFMKINMMLNNGGTVTAYYTAYSPDGSKIQFKSSDFTTDASGDKNFEVPDEDGNTLIATKADLDFRDWASYQTGTKGLIPFDNDYSQNLKSQTALFIIGYTLGMDAQAGGLSTVEPWFSQTTVGKDGLPGGQINISGRNLDKGNSGGPVFAFKDGKYVVIGLVSSYMGQSIAFLPPIATVK